MAASTQRWTARLGILLTSGCAPADSVIVALDLETGDEAWRFSLPATPAAPAVRHGEMAVLADLAGTIYALPDVTPVRPPIDHSEVY